VSKRARIVAFGAAALFVVAGAVCAALIAAETGQVLALVLIGLGLVGVVSLLFLEVGLSEDREVARDRERRARAQRRADARTTRLPRGRPRLGRNRGERRRLSGDQ
jgi:hypothetical protein